MREKMVELQGKRPMKSADDGQRITEEIKTLLANEAAIFSEKTAAGAVDEDQKKRLHEVKLVDSISIFLFLMFLIFVFR